LKNSLLEIIASFLSLFPITLYYFPLPATEVYSQLPLQPVQPPEQPLQLPEQLPEQPLQVPLQPFIQLLRQSLEVQPLLHSPPQLLLAFTSVGFAIIRPTTATVPKIGNAFLTALLKNSLLERISSGSLFSIISRIERMC